MEEQLRKALQLFVDGEISLDDVLRKFSPIAYEEHLIGKFDVHRSRRTGIPEVVFTPNKNPQDVIALFEAFKEKDRQLIASRVDAPLLARLQPLCEFIDDTARIAALKVPTIQDGYGDVLVVSAGGSDRPVAAEAMQMARLLGNPATQLEDVGVAGIQRLFAHREELDKADILIVVAGMDAALGSVVGGFAHQPVIAVPTSVGYGASFHGISALLSMLNSCAAGVAVMNIDNGFGAAVHATKINQLALRARERQSQK